MKGPMQTTKNLYVLAEFESDDMEALILGCKALDCRFSPNKWFGDSERTEVVQILSEVNRDGGKSLHISPLWPWLLEAKDPYQPMLSAIHRLLKTERKRLFLRGSVVGTSLNEIKRDEIYELRFGHFPAIEALAIAVRGMDNLVDTEYYEHYHYHDRIADLGVQPCDLLKVN